MVLRHPPLPLALARDQTEFLIWVIYANAETFLAIEWVAERVLNYTRPAGAYRHYLRSANVLPQEVLYHDGFAVFSYDAYFPEVLALLPFIL